ncbi:MAG: golvesin C-terminal-like domain-containing protein [Myxococcaceae bacterium]
MRLAFSVSILCVSLHAIEARAADDCGLEPPGSVQWTQPVPTKRFERKQTTPLVRRDLRFNGRALSSTPTLRSRTGALSGKTVYLSQGHGFTYTPALGRWATQRSTTQQLVEDLASAESVNQYLIPLLQGAGANVVTVRESDTNAQMVIVDNSSADYAEKGSAALFASSSAAGFAPLPMRLVNGTDPFASGDNRLMNAVQGAATASATWTLKVPTSDYYNVYVTYSAFTARVTDAHFVVRHAGGDSHFRINQRAHGSTWVLLGRFYFRAGAASLIAFNDSEVVGGNISLDAVRLGGGAGLIPRPDPASPLSGRPRYEESSRYHAQFMGAPLAVYDDATLTDRDEDVSARPRFAAWDHEVGEDAVYVAWHTNAANAAASGTETYAYGVNPPDGAFQFSGVAGSDLLGRAVHAELIKDIRAGWDPAWTDRRLRTAFFGELNPANNNEMPSILVELAFHDAPNDAAKLRDPAFRYLSARAVAQGIIRYFLTKDAKPIVLPPEPPSALFARNKGGGQVEVGWQAAAVDAQDLGGGTATSFRLYQSDDGLAFDDGTEMIGTAFNVTLAVGQVRYFRVAAVNAGGESFPSIVVGAQGAAVAPAAVLVVNGFDRLDSSLGRLEDMSTYQLGAVYRALVDRMNSGTYVARHGEALKPTLVGFDSASHSALGSLTLKGYSVVDWIAGRGRATGKALTAAELTALTEHVTKGGALLFSGGQVLAPLTTGTAQEQAFAQQVLKISAAAPGMGTVRGQALAPFTDLPVMTLDDGLQGAYAAGSEALTPAGSDITAVYQGTSTAAVASQQKLLTLGFPFETLVSAEDRVTVMKRAMDYFRQTAIAGADAGTPPPPPLEDIVPSSVISSSESLSPQEEATALADATGCSSTSGSPSLWLALLCAVLTHRILRGSRRAAPSAQAARVRPQGRASLSPHPPRS